jgi:hypothetical protein
VELRRSGTVPSVQGHKSTGSEPLILVLPSFFHVHIVSALVHEPRHRPELQHAVGMAGRSFSCTTPIVEFSSSRRSCRCQPRGRATSPPGGNSAPYHRPWHCLDMACVAREEGQPLPLTSGAGWSGRLSSRFVNFLLIPLNVLKCITNQRKMVKMRNQFCWVHQFHIYNIFFAPARN